LHDRPEETSAVPSIRRSVLLLLALFACLAPLALSACGSDDGGDDVASVLKDTFGSGKPVKSGKLAVGITLNAKGLDSLPGPVALKLSGPFQSKGKDELPAFDFDLSLNAGGQSFTAGAVSTGQKGFLTFQGQAFAVGDQLYQQFRSGYQQAQKQSGAKKDGPTFKTLGIDPLRWLADPKNAGTEDVGGAETTHVTATIDVPKFLLDINTLLKKADAIGVPGTQQQVPGTLTAAQRKQIADAVKSAKVDVYSGKDDRLLRRLVVEIAFDVPAASRKDAGGLESGTLKLDLTITDLNKDQTITEPKDARPLEELTSQLGLGGATTGAAGATGATGTDTEEDAATPSGTTTGAEPAANPEYLDCLDKAGTDLAAVQKCATQLSK